MTKTAVMKFWMVKKIKRKRKKNIFIKNTANLTPKLVKYKKMLSDSSCKLHDLLLANRHIHVYMFLKTKKCLYIP